MTLQLPEELERFVAAEVRRGRFSSPDEVVAAAVRLLRQRGEAEDARAVEAIRRGLDDVRAGRTQPAAEAIAEIRRELDLPQGP